ncbi:ABC transporter ATP-binding protein [Paenibacillus sp. IB182496]|uniref:ABC transporter ATP-binding protein n=1 Tax=Paenibacillus sabuli TaxID=2772509 RepID=A0A927GU07_9BACL|nr:ABC transporter ATP-binding protein [Paenibacillus sabuli]MBD2847650.1 ABC transporter ATP-binding protein [Paenibacillus sabuli]
MAVLEIRELTKKFGTYQALNGVNLDVNGGEIFGFIGPNGAGKSTTIRVLLGILRATSGQAQIFGKEVWRDAVDIHKRIAYVPGDVHLWPNLTGGEVIDLWVKLKGGGSRQKRDLLVQQYDLDPTKKCRTYSKGNRQKVALIAAFASDSDLFILDEPTSGLDPLMEQVFQDCVMDVKKQGKSVLLSSHILSEVERLCDTIGIIRQGKIIESGAMRQLRHLTRTHVKAELRQPVPGLAQLDGIHALAAEGSILSFEAESEAMDAAIRQLSQCGIVKLECSPPTLEDLFMRHYEGAGGGVR